MATKKDLVEAHAFSRRRLVTAFVSGAPGGREVEPVRPGRVLIGGIALSVLLLAGAAIAGFLLGRPPAQWLEAGSFIISKDTGEQYVVMRGGDDPLLQRVPNFVSAQLLLQRGRADPVHRARQVHPHRPARRGPRHRGRPGRPAVGRRARRRRLDRVHRRRRRHQGRDPGAARTVEDLTESAFLVSSGGEQWLIATAPADGSQPGRAYRFPMPAGRDQRLDRSATSSASARPRSRSTRSGSTSSRSADALEEDVLRRRRRRASRCPTPTPAPTSRSSRSATCCCPAPAPTTSSATRSPSGSSDFAGMVYDVVGVAGRSSSTATCAPSSATPATPPSGPQDLPGRGDGGALCGVLHPGVRRRPRGQPGHQPDRCRRPGRGHGPVATRSTSSPAPGPTSCPGPTPRPTAVRPTSSTPRARSTPCGPQVPDYIGYADVEPPLVPSTWLGFFELRRDPVDQQRTPGARGRAAAADSEPEADSGLMTRRMPCVRRSRPVSSRPPSCRCGPGRRPPTTRPRARSARCPARSGWPTRTRRTTRPSTGCTSSRPRRSRRAGA